MKKNFIAILLILIAFNNTANPTVLELSEKEVSERIEQDGIDNFPDPIIISLGFSCTAADMLRANNLRCFAFPFDWIRSSFHGLCNLLQDDFVDFLNPECLIFENTCIRNKKYVLTFHHDFPPLRTCGRVDYIKENYLDYLEEVVAKYNRRIERLYRALNSGKTVYLFRLGSHTRPWNLDPILQTQEDIESLRDIFLEKFPDCDFTLVVIDNDDSYKDDWNAYRIKNFYIEDPLSNDEWGKIFKTLGVVVSTRSDKVTEFGVCQIKISLNIFLAIFSYHQ